MAQRDFDAVFYLKKPPTVRFEDGMFFVCYKVGDAHFEFVMRPKCFAAAMLGAEEARAQWSYQTMDRGNVRKIKP